MKIRTILLTTLIVILTACSVGGGSGTPTVNISPTPSPTLTLTPTLPSPQVITTRVPDPRSAAQTFFGLWQKDDYEKMYAMLAKLSRDAIASKDFSARYRDFAANLSLQRLDFEVLSVLVSNPSAAQAAVRLTYNTSLAGELKRDVTAQMALEDGTWKIRWEEGLIMPELRGGNKLVMEYKIPARGNILDRAGVPLASMSDAVAFGVVPGQVGDESTEKSMLEVLSRMMGRPPESIRAMYEKAAPTWYVPIGEISLSDLQTKYGDLSGFTGLIMNRYKSRFYYDNGVAPHVLGYVQSIPKERIDEYRRLGYRGDEKVGASGLEKWAEKYLSGDKGVSLYVSNSQGQIITRLAQSEPLASQSLTSTIDKNLQVEAQKALLSFRGSVVVLERDTGRVLAMVSSPGYDPNYFEPTNYNSVGLAATLSDSTSRLLNRAAQGGGYPLGSVFKIITMSAALESGIYTPESSYNCGLSFTELPGVTIYDWTYDKGYAASGKLNLPEGLMRSCNPWFYHIGLDLYRQNRDADISNLARAFGLGKVTGMDQVAEEAGKMPDPVSEVDAVQLSIGQGTMLVTPLQVARFIAALGNGGTLLRPQVVEKISTPDGVPVLSFKPEEQGKLPLKPETMKVVQQAMRMVVNDPRGTAYTVFTGMGIPIYGKTGTAQTGTGNKPHAWFAGYTDYKKADKPDIAVAVIAENAGEGSEIAAPIFRRIIEIYFLGRPEKLYPWEASRFNLTRTPTLPPTATPYPSPTPVQK